MMGGMMMDGMMMPMFFWMILGTLLFLAVIVAVIWLLVRALRPQRMPTTQPWQQQNPSPPYQQGYSSPGSGSETYQEGGRTHPYSEQPSATYPQEQQEQRPPFSR